MFKWKAPTAQMQGRFSNWTSEDTTSFQSLLTEVGQVCILVETKTEGTNPYGFQKISAGIITALGKLNYVEGQQYIIMQLPNITKVMND